MVLWALVAALGMVLYKFGLGKSSIRVLDIDRDLDLLKTL